MTSTPQLSASLEDYVKTICKLVRAQKIARVRDIARIRGVRAASVTIAMRRLMALGLIRYEKREYIDLTSRGEQEAQRILSRHQVLKRFLSQVLKMPEQNAGADACAMEHSLSTQGMDYIVRFLEFLNNCPDGQRFLELFHRCTLYQNASGNFPRECQLQGDGETVEINQPVRLISLAPGSRTRVAHITRLGASRERLLDMGLLPDVALEVRAVTQHASGEVQVQLETEGFHLELQGDDARAVMVAPPEASR
jgi:DtxR family Mn-dependent transcriptional regulator